MLNDASGFRRIYLATGYTDLRRGMEGLASIIKFNFQLDPYQKDILFLFCGRRTDRIKGLVWEGDGFLLLYKRLELGAFNWPRTKEEALEITPEQYMADAIVKALMVGILAIPAFFISVFFGFLILGIALFVYFSESKKVTRKIRQKRANIEYELPRLVGHIEKLLTHSRDIIYILESYIPIAHPELKEELFITVAEMRSSGNIRNALDSLDKRIGSAWLSEVVRALETVENSADTTALWTSLSMKFKELQRLNLKAQANAIPRKVKKLSMALMMCFLLIYIAVIGQVLMNSLSGIM